MKIGIREHKSQNVGDSIPVGQKPLLSRTQVSVPVITGEGGWETVDVTDYLTMTSMKPLVDVTPLEAAEFLEKISGMRYFLWERYLHVRRMRVAAEIQFEAWWAKVWVKTTAQLRGGNISEVNSGARSKSKIDPTQKDVESTIISESTVEWREQKDRMASLIVKEKEILGLYNIVDKRGDELRVMIKEIGALLWKQ